MKAPSTDWQERIAPDEEAHLNRVAEVMGKLQRRRSAKYGPGRALHRKQLLATTGSLKVLDGLPDYARHGLFATPGTHPVLARFSNGGPEVQSNRAPDIRGFAIQVSNVSGPSALGGTTDHQDFLMINQDRLPTSDSREFVDFLKAATQSPIVGLLHLFTAHGPVGGFARARALFASLGKKFNGFAAEPFNTVAPICCGPYAVRVRLKPVGNPPPEEPPKDIVADLRERLAIWPVEWDMELQFFVDEATTPIEDTSKPWPDSETPIVTVARLLLVATSDLADKQAEAARFDPWAGLAAHRPLGEIMRARKTAYYASQQGRP